VRIGNGHEAIGNSKTTEPFSFSVCNPRLYWAGSEKINRNRERVRNRVREQRNLGKRDRGRDRGWRTGIVDVIVFVRELGAKIARVWWS
jgi:hypothetical protein